MYTLLLRPVYVVWDYWLYFRAHALMCASWFLVNFICVFACCVWICISLCRIGHRTWSPLVALLMQWSQQLVPNWSPSAKLWTGECLCLLVCVCVCVDVRNQYISNPESLFINFYISFALYFMREVVRVFEANWSAARMWWEEWRPSNLCKCYLFLLPKLCLCWRKWKLYAHTITPTWLNIQTIDWLDILCDVIVLSFCRCIDWLEIIIDH